MKIALMSFEYPIETGFGGIGTYTWYQARGLAKLGHEVHVLAGAIGPTMLRSEEHDGVKVYRFRADGPLMRCFRRLDKFSLWWTKNRLENALSMYRGLEVLRDEHHYDLVEMPECGAEGLLVNSLMSETTLTKFHSPAQLIMRYYDVQLADIFFCSMVERLGFRRSGAFSSCSNFLAGEARQKLGIRPHIQVIPNGIDLELFDAADQVDFYHKFDIPRDRLTIFFSGRMEQRKGIHLCAEIAAPILERYEVAFVFAGQDLFNYMSDCLLPELKARKLKGSVHYLGKLDLADVRSCLRQTDIFLIPSLWENCPYSCLEAMAAGRAIVSSDAGGMPELIHDGENGLVARSENPGEFIACLERMIEDHALRDRLGHAARRTIEQSYTDVHIARLSVDYYERCVQSSTASTPDNGGLRAWKNVARKILKGKRPRQQIGREQGELKTEQSALEGNLAGLQPLRPRAGDLLRELEIECDSLKCQVHQLASARDSILHSREYRAGNYLINRLCLRAPLDTASRLWTAGRHRLTTGRLAAERRFLKRGGAKIRALATVCSNFPIYSQTFVYQELVQLARNGFDLRLVYSNLDSRDYLQTQFGELWKAKRRLYINRKVHEHHFARYCKLMPEKVEMLVGLLSEASGLARHDLVHHDNFLQAFSFTRMVESYRPHYLHSYFFYDRSLMALVASYLLGIPRGVSCYADHLLDDYELKVVPLHLQLCDLVVATSERIKKELLDIAPDTDPDRIIVKPNAVDVNQLPVMERGEPRTEESFRLACVSRIEPKKGLLYLVEAVDILRQRGWRVELHLVGAADEGVQASQSYKQELDRQILSLDLWGTVHLEGRQNQEGVLRFLGLSHLFVAPFVETNTGDKDGIPTALLEAMATGLPAVATDSGSISEVIEDGREGIIVPQRDAFALAGAIEALLRDPGRRRQMGRAAAEKVRLHFDVGVCEKALHERVRATIKTRFPSS